MLQRRAASLTALSCTGRLSRVTLGAVLFLAVSVGGIIPACAAAGQKIYLYAAASLQAPLEKITASYEQKTGNPVVLVTGGSGDLARQIEQGAPANLFISANTEWADYLLTRNLTVPKTRVNLLGNILVAVTSPCRGKLNAPIADLLKQTGDSRIAMANPDSVPAGAYAKQALIKLGLWPLVEKRAAFAEDVRSTLGWVIRCESELGFVYETDALASAKKGINVAARFPADSYPPIIYPLVVIAQGNSEQTGKLAAYLSGDEAFAMFESFGFVKP